MIVHNKRKRSELMNGYFDKYFCGELSEGEKEEFLSSVDCDSALKEEFIETSNLLGIVNLLPHKGDMDDAQRNLEKFMEYIKNREE